MLTSKSPKRPVQKKQNKLGPYNLLQTLGEGEFGKVKLGIHSETGQETLNHPYIVKLFNVVETEKYIGIILEYASGKLNSIFYSSLFFLGGELFEYILAHRYLKEKDAKRFFAQLISSVQYMHKRKIVHRDLKLENLLLDKNRNIIVTDFGFANQFSSAADDLMATTCGSPCYAAPELVVNAGLYAGSAVDIWSCGVILYAMLCGFLPFDDDPSNPDSDNINQLYRYILSTHLMFPAYVSLDARDLLQRMLVPDPAKRCSLDYIIRHPWLDSHRDFLRKDASQIRMDALTASRLASTPATTPVTNTHIPVASRDRFAPVANDRFITESKPRSSNERSVSPSSTANDRPTVHATVTPTITTRNSKVPSFITRKPVKQEDEAILIEDIVQDTDNNPEKSLSSPLNPQDTKIPTASAFGSIRKNQRRGTDKFLSFFTITTNYRSRSAQVHIDTSTSSISLTDDHAATSPTIVGDTIEEEVEDEGSADEAALVSSFSFRDEETSSSISRQQYKSRDRGSSMSAASILSENSMSITSSILSFKDTPRLVSNAMGDGGRKAMAAVRRSIYRKHRSQPPPHSETSSQTSSQHGTKEPAQPALTSNKSSTTNNNEAAPPPKRTGKKMMDWIKKKSHGKRPRISILPSVSPAPLEKKIEEPVVVIESESSRRKNRALSGNESDLPGAIKISIDERIQIHQGAIDRSALTSQPPADIMKDIKRILRILGIEAKLEVGTSPFVLKCSRRKANGVAATDARGLEPIYGDASIDNGDEVRFAVEVCRFKNLPGLYIVDIRRLRGNVWAYKFLYHKLIDFLNAGRDSGCVL
ncbi:kinase-like domain-containing protein [Helicostylum pulchrum]|nr:kinase-like domain-containing protein [Helicostylum pulchrum]